MDDFLVGSDLCEENRFLGQARLLRAMAGEGGKVYFLAERGAEYNDCFDEVPDEDGEFQNLFLDLEAAHRAADLGNARKFREINLWDFGYETADLTSLDEQFVNNRVGEIIGTPFALRGDGEFRSRIEFPETATDDQMVAIAALFDKLRFFHVIEAEFFG
jgi:hypothetical protein